MDGQPLSSSRFTVLEVHFAGLEDGFRIGFNYGSKACRPAKRNMSSAGGHKTVINSYIEEERALRRLVSSDDGSGRVQISPFG